jgi:hypothetical protein
VTLKILTPEGAEALGNEGVYNAGQLVGRVTSANHAQQTGSSPLTMPALSLRLIHPTR